MKRVEIIFTPEAQKQADCKGPTFENPTSCLIEDSGVFVYTVTKDTKEPCEYFYPMHQVARVKSID